MDICSEVNGEGEKKLKSKPGFGVGFGRGGVPG